MLPFINSVHIWLMILLAANETTGISFNLPKIWPSATWNPNGITFANATILRNTPWGLFVNRNDTVAVTVPDRKEVSVWFEGNSTATKISNFTTTNTVGVFLTTNNDIYVDNGYGDGYVYKWSRGGTTPTRVMNVNDICYSLFVDVNEDLYCCLSNLNKVVKKSLNASSISPTKVAGASNAGSTSTKLNFPRGIFVDLQLNLYVADSNNNRIQLFRPGNLTGTTVVGNGAPGTIVLNRPAGVILDANGYFYIADYGNHRIVASGSNGFRCIIGCTGTRGSTSNRLHYPYALSFDSRGNLFISDMNNWRIQKFILTTDSRKLSFNQPKFCASATWNPNATTFADNSSVGYQPIGIFVDTNNNVHVPAPSFDRLQLWRQGNMTALETIPYVSGIAYDVFMGTNNDLFINSGLVYVQINKWIHNATSPIPVMYVNATCYSLFIDIYENLYCSVGDLHKVVKKLYVDSWNSTTTIAGNGTHGSTAYMLFSPRGIFVDKELNLYVADLINNRIQLFTFGNLSGRTVAGNGAPGTIDLWWPTDVALDADGYLFIVDFHNDRIIGSSANGFRCIVGCTNTSGSASDQLLNPWSFSFDTFGNIFVTDCNNNRIQKFTLTENSCGISYNLPKLSSCASWNPVAVTLADSTTTGGSPTSVFVSANNVIYAVGSGFDRVRVWWGGSAIPSTTIARGLNDSRSVFVTINEEVYIDNGAYNKRVEKWMNNGTSNKTAMYVEGMCYSLFVDVNENLYCCLGLFHKVVKKPFNANPNVTIIVAGNGTPGSASHMLNNPTGIFVDIQRNLYVADCSNNRIQFFQPGNLNGTSIVGEGVPGTIALSCPNAVMLDGDGTLYILEYHNPRVIRSTSNGFRCIVGCTGTNGSAPDQMFRPWSFTFDSDGNILVADTHNNRIQKFILTRNSCNVSYNQPKLSACATWNQNATTFANNDTIGPRPYGLFVDTNDNVYTSDDTSGRISIWLNGSISPTRNISLDFNITFSLFVSTNGEIFVDNGARHRRVEKWSFNATNATTVMNVNPFCCSLFVDVTNTLYCAMGEAHLVNKTSLYRGMNSTKIAAGNGTAGSGRTMLSYPRGVLVDTMLNMYVADSGNNRIQLFEPENLTGTTIVGNGASGTINLNVPMGLAVDDAGHLFIADSQNSRIIGSGINGFRCIVGCTSTRGSPSNQLAMPSALSFDSYGNLFVVDTYNDRIQKFSLINNICEEPTTIVMDTTTQEISTMLKQTSMPITASQSILINQTCFAPTITIIPSTSSLLLPLQFRRNQDFYISSNIQLDCDSSLSTIIRWAILNCTFNCSSEILLDQTVVTTFSELYIPARTLPYGFFELRLTVTMAISSNLFSSKSAYVRITPSGITANLVQFGTSMITRGYVQDLLLDPGSYSVDYDTDTFNASDWIYDYSCRIYGRYNFPNINGIPLSIDDPRIYSDNASCFTNQSGNRTPWKYNGVNASMKSALTILSRSLLSNRTYQFMVRMENRRNFTNQALGYLLVRVDDSHPQMILIACVISTLCVPNVEFQLVNPTTQVALFSLCSETCPSILNITWNIYQGLNGSTSIVEWLLFNRMNQYENIWFFGRNTTNFTALNRLFSENPQITLWRFEVVYTFISEISSSALNFIVNQSPTNGSCSIYPHNGTTSTPFTISCPNWFDQDDIKDYSIYSYTTDRTKQVLIAYSSLSDFTVYLPAGAENTSILHTIIYIRDTLDCITEYNMTSILVTLDTAEINDLINTLQDTKNSVMNNSFTRTLLTGSPYTVSQAINIFSQSFNQINTESLQNAISNGLPATSISVSSLGSANTQQTTVSFNASAQREYNRQLNTFANVRDYLMPFIANLPITASSNIKLQASSLAQLTQATNQLTRTAAILASKKCYQLARSLYSMARKTPYEDVQTIASQLAQCTSNVLSAINGPLQQRTNVLDLDSSRANSLPLDYDTDLESEWANPHLFADGTDFSYSTIKKNRNIYYQKQQANEIIDQTIETMSLLTNALKIHINLGQNSTMNTSSVIMSLETLSMASLSNKVIQSVGDAQIQLPENFQVNFTEVSLRSIMQPLAPAGDSSNTYLSRSISLSIYDQNGNEVPIRSTSNQSIEIIIPRDPNFIMPFMALQNVTTLSSTPHQHLYNLHYVNITSTLSISVHFEMRPHNTSLAYLLIYKFDGAPQLNSSIKVIDGWALFCPSNLNNESIHTYFLNNQRTMTHQSIIFGLRELNTTNDCVNHSIDQPPISDEPFRFSSNYELLVYTSGCYYLDEDHRWQSDGLIVGPRTNHQFTQCYSTHLTTFTSGFNVLSELVNWNYVFSKNDIMTNQVIYLTCILFTILNLFLMICARFTNQQHSNWLMTEDDEQIESLNDSVPFHQRKPFKFPSISSKKKIPPTMGNLNKQRKN